MLGLPQSTELKKIITKKQFYENVEVSTAIKKGFSAQIHRITWRDKLATTTLNVATGERVEEVEVFELRLNQSSIDESLLKQIDTVIPYHILFVLEYEGKCQACIGYKEINDAGKNAAKVTRYYYTDWTAEADFAITIEGLSMDAIYENIVRQIAGDALADNKQETLQDSVEREQKRQALQKKIKALEGKIRKEKQLNRQMKLNGELKQLKKELEGI